MLHNLWYWSLAIVQWTFWEQVMMRLWATGKVPYASNQEILADKSLLLWNLVWVLLIPLWRELHFYIAHRFIHVRAVYKYVHSLHHRCADPEPFSGMTMHPIEHLYYFSNAFTPTLYLPHLSPLIFLWNYLHLALAPGAAHSGWEDHFGSDQYHYLHHAKFECNYGTPMSGFIDQLCGTFRERSGESEQYKGQWDAAKVASAGNAESTPGKAGVWSATGYLGLPATWDHGVYTVYWVCWGAATWCIAAAGGSGGIAADVAAAGVAYSPVAFALLLAAASGDRMSWRWPFHKERLFGVCGMFLTAGFLACMLPVYHATKWLCE